ncbi:MAG TPA: sigma-70 family RNA polymerase sigma factor [Gammaproteobacteria bacterium]|nr:sigma-70 family RNA polymerase sigma factor [Gammaproteobacteria bacterium]
MQVADSELIAKVLLDDDRHAFATLIRRNQSAVRGLLRRLTNGNEALSDDLAQETFIKSYQSLKSFRGGAKFSTWLHRIAYNAFISHVRGEKATLDYEDYAQTEPGHPGEAQNLNLEHDLRQAMRRLTDAERSAIQLCCQCGFSHGEAAEILQQPLGTVKTNVLRGKEKLRDSLAVWQEVAYE